MEVGKKRGMVALLDRKKVRKYLFLINLFSFLSIRISGYNTSSTDSIGFIVTLIFNNSIIKKDFFLFEIAILILLTVVFYCTLIVSKCKVCASILLFLLWCFIFLNFKWLFDLFPSTRITQSFTRFLER